MIRLCKAKMILELSRQGLTVATIGRRTSRDTKIVRN